MVWAPDYQAYGPIEATAEAAHRDEFNIRSRYFPRYILRWIWRSELGRWERDPRTFHEFFVEASGVKRDRYA